MFSAKHLIRIDGIAGLVVGVIVIAIHGWLADLYQLPNWLILSNGTANIIYGTYSTILASRSHRRMPAILLLIFANAIWAFVCLFVIALFANSATIFGVGHFGFESLFVGGMALLEWRYRNVLRTDLQSPKLHPPN